MAGTRKIDARTPNRPTKTRGVFWALPRAGGTKLGQSQFSSEPVPWAIWSAEVKDTLEKENKAFEGKMRAKKAR